MSIMTLRKRTTVSSDESDSPDCIKYAAGGALIAGGLMLLGNQKRAGMVLGAAGAGLALVDQQDTVRTWWSHIPEYVDRVQDLIGQVQSKVDEFSAKRDSLRNVLSGNRP